jgi:hypothetical protein
VDQSKVLVSDTELELAHSLDKRSRLDISHGASELNDADIRFLASVIHRNSGHTFHPILDSIRDMGDDLDSLAKVITLALTLNDIAVDLARRDVVGPGQGHIKVTLVVTKIEIDFTTVVQNKDFTYEYETSQQKELRLLSPLPTLQKKDFPTQQRL